MIIDSEHKQMLMEVRDINYILPAYIRSYQFHSKNQIPLKIIQPMFPSVKVGNKNIPIEYVPPLDSIATEIAKDGSNVPEVTPEQEAALDKKDEEIKKLKAEVESLTTNERGEAGLGGTPEQVGGTQIEVTTSEQLKDEAADVELEEDTKVTPSPESPAKAAFKEEPSTMDDAATLVAPNRKPKQPPGGAIPPGQPLSDMGARDRNDQSRAARDLVDEPNIDGATEKPFEKTVSRGEDGKPVVEDKNE